jgi:N-methylhydantoinase B/oxoprolinase/acetone carboxylase alpha subunit
MVSHLGVDVGGIFIDVIVFDEDTRVHDRQSGVNSRTSEKTPVRTDGTEADLPSKAENAPVEPGDKLVFRTTGGGGLGDPPERNPDLIAGDPPWPRLRGDYSRGVRRDSRRRRFHRLTEHQRTAR